MDNMFATIMITLAQIGPNLSEMIPMISFVEILPIIVNDISVAPKDADKPILVANPDRCCDTPVMEVCRTLNTHIHIKLTVRTLNPVRLILICFLSFYS